jgi:long-chain fatty acid transport protein
MLLGGIGTCALALWGTRAEASPVFELTGDVQGPGGLQARTTPGGAFAAYFNPALLTDTPAHLQVGFVTVVQRIGITVDGRPGPQFDVPSGVGIENATHADFTPIDGVPYPTRDLELGRPGVLGAPDFRARPRQGAGTGQETFYYLAFGFVIKALKDRFAFGLNGMIPTGDFTTIHAYFNDEREQYFSNSLHPELYGDRLTAPSIGMGAAVKPTDDFSLGAGATLSLKAVAGAQAYVADPGDLGDILIDMNAPVGVSLAPHFGATYTLLDKRLRLSAAAHSPSKMEFDVAFAFGLGTGVEQSSGATFVLNYLPWRASAGAALDVVHDEGETLTLAGTLLYANWHTYVDRRGERPSPAYPWADTLSPTLGARYTLGRFSALVDASYVPTPVPPQTGRKNYVDNDRVSGAFGGEYEFDVFGSALHVGLQFQTHYLLTRHQYKLPTPPSPSGAPGPAELVKDEVPDDAAVSGMPISGAQGLQTNNPGWPGFQSSGVLLAGGFYLRAEL